MSAETDKIRANAADSAAQADAIDQKQNVDITAAVQELETVTIPAIESARVSVQTALDTLKKSLNPPQ